MIKQIQIQLKNIFSICYKNFSFFMLSLLIINLLVFFLIYSIIYIMTLQYIELNQNLLTSDALVLFMKLLVIPRPYTTLMAMVIYIIPISLTVTPFIIFIRITYKRLNALQFLILQYIFSFGILFILLFFIMLTYFIAVVIDEHLIITGTFLTNLVFKTSLLKNVLKITCMFYILLEWGFILIGVGYVILCDDNTSDLMKLILLLILIIFAMYSFYVLIPYIYHLFYVRF